MRCLLAGLACVVGACIGCGKSEPQPQSTAVLDAVAALSKPMPPERWECSTKAKRKDDFGGGAVVYSLSLTITLPDGLRVSSFTGDVFAEDELGSRLLMWPIKAIADITYSGTFSMEVECFPSDNAGVETLIKHPDKCRTWIEPLQVVPAKD